MSLFECPGVLPECPLDQSDDTAYTKIDPFRLNADEEIGPGRGSNAVVTDGHQKMCTRRSEEKKYFSGVYASPCTQS